MSDEIGKARDEFLYGQIKGNKSLYLGIAITYALATIAAVIMAIAAVATGRLNGALTVTLMGIGLGGAAVGSWSEYKDYAAALEEIGPSPEGVDTCRTYSRKTARAISQSRRDAKTLLQLWIAYGILAITMIGMGSFLAAIMLVESKEYLFAAIGAGLVAGGFIILFLAIKALRDWRMAKRIEAFEKKAKQGAPMDAN